MKREGLSLFQAKREAQQIANDRQEPCLIYKQSSVTGARHFGVVNSRDAKGWQLGASTRCKYPEEVGDGKGLSLIHI